MATNIRHAEWRKSLEATKFPFSHLASLQNDAGDTLLEGTFLDASLYPIGGTARMYLSRVTVAADMVTLVIGDTETTDRASCSFDPADPPSELRLLDSYDRPAGVLVSEPVRLAVFAGWSIGDHEFFPTSTPFVARCCLPAPEIGVRGFELETGEVITGDVWLVGGDGVVLSSSSEWIPAEGDGAGTYAEVIRIDIVGEPLFKRKSCQDDGLFQSPRFLQQLRFNVGGAEYICGPDARGNINITAASVSAADTVLRVRAVPAGMCIEIVGEELGD